MTSTVRAVLATALALPGLAPAAVPAAPSAAFREYAATGTTLVARNGTVYHVGITAYGADPQGYPPSVTLVVRRCAPRARPAACVQVTDARFAVPPSAVSIAADLSGARLTTSYGGVPIDVTWTSAADPPVVPGVQAWATPTVRVGPQRAATAVVTAFGTRCARHGAVARETATVSTEDLHATRADALPAALTGGTRLTCRADDPVPRRAR